MTYSIVYAKDVIKEDIPKLSYPVKKTISTTITKKLTTHPTNCKPLRYSYKGCRALKVGDYRVIFKIVENTVQIIKIGHRKEI